MHRILSAGSASLLMVALGVTAVTTTADEGTSPAPRATTLPKPKAAPSLAKTGANATAGDDAKALLTAIGKRYRSLSSYDFEGKSHMEMTVQGQTQVMDVPFRLATVKPTKMRIEIANPMMSVTRVSDGQQTWVYVPEAQQYTMKVATPLLTDGASAEDVGGAMALGTPLQRYLSVTEHLAGARVKGTANVAVGNRSVPCIIVEARYAVPESAQVEMSPNTFWIDRKSNLILRDSVQVVVQGPGGSPATIATITSFDRAVIDEPLHDSLFTFRPPADAKLVDNIALPGMAEATSPFVGKPAEDFTLTDLAGKRQKLASLKGKVVLIDFWATWCGPCRREMPNIVKLHRELAPKGLAVVAVNVGESAATVKAYLKKNGYTLPVWLDGDTKVSMKYNAQSIPTLVVIDREGIVSSYMVGLRGEEDLRAALKKAGLD